VAKQPSLADWQLVLVDWGYNTEAERRRAATNERIEVVGIDRFVNLAHGAAAEATAQP
jgi:hypothetical protein